MLYYKIGFVLDDFAQLYTNVSVLSTFYVVYITMVFSRLGALNAFLFMIFSTEMGLLGCNPIANQGRSVYILS